MPADLVMEPPLVDTLFFFKAFWSTVNLMASAAALRVVRATRSGLVY